MELFCIHNTIDYLIYFVSFVNTIIALTFYIHQLYALLFYSPIPIISLCPFTVFYFPILINNIQTLFLFQF